MSENPNNQLVPIAQYTILKRNEKLPPIGTQLIQAYTARMFQVWPSLNSLVLFTPCFLLFLDHERKRRDTVAEESRKWQGGIVPYVFGFTAGYFLFYFFQYNQIVYS